MIGILQKKDADFLYNFYNAHTSGYSSFTARGFLFI